MYNALGQQWIPMGGGYDVRFGSLEERDPATGFDPTPARQYTSTLGRWLTPDPAGRNAVRLDDPQSWNMYAYVRNNPTTLTDPSGLNACGPKVADKDCHVVVTFKDRTQDKKGNYNDQFKNAGWRRPSRSA